MGCLQRPASDFRMIEGLRAAGISLIWLQISVMNSHMPRDRVISRFLSKVREIASCKPSAPR
jgi:hypothetical protein